MNCNNYFDMTDQGDSFESWQGLRGPYYTPHVAADGVLSWTNTGNLPNPAPVDISGHPGSGVELRGPVATVYDLPVTAPASELWQVGTQAPYNGYFFNGTAWANLGPVAAGATFTPAVSSAGVISWANDGGLPNPEPVDIKGPQGATGATGADGVSPEVTIAQISGGHSVTISDADHPQGQQFDVLDGQTGATGPAGPGVPAGGSGGQVLKKQSATDYDTAWAFEDLGITGASVGDLVRISAVSGGKPTAYAKAPLNAIKCNRNLLDNWYFVGGGSQQGYGVFPINQRGQASYSNAGYCIDRWYANGVSVAVNSGNITVSNSQSATKEFVQRFGFPFSSLASKTVTLSVLGSDGTLYTKSGTVASSAPGSSAAYISNGIPSVGTMLFGWSVAYAKFYLDFIIDSGKSLGLVAVKLELGSEQTLAHQENGVWVLNEIPDYTAELAKCQAYLLPISSLSRTRTNIVLDNVLGFDVPVPVTMAKTPAIVGTLRVSTLTGSFVTGFTFDVGGISDNAVRIRASKTSHGLTDGFIDSDAVWYLSAE